MSRDTYRLRMGAFLLSLTPVMAAGCVGDNCGDVVGEAQSALTVWEEPLPSHPSLAYPVVGNPKGPWEDGLTAQQMTSIGPSCSFAQEGSTCGNGYCEPWEGTDPTTCWEDCVKQPWCNGVNCTVPGVPDKYLDKVVLYGVSSARYWNTDPDTNEPLILIADRGYSNPAAGTSKAGYGSQLLIVRRLNQPRDGLSYCVEKRFRGRYLDTGPLSFVQNADKTHDYHIVLSDTNASTLYKLNGAFFTPMWKLDGLAFNAETSGDACNAGHDPNACCSAEGCDKPFTQAPSGAPSGGISHENMIREVNDDGKWRYVISNRDWATLAMVDANDDVVSSPVVKSGTNRGLVSWAFGRYGQLAASSGDLCKLNWPSGVKYFPDTDKLYQADSQLGRVIEIPYLHGCYQSAGTPTATLIDGAAPLARAVERTSGGAPFYTQDVLALNPSAQQYPVESAWFLKANMALHGALAGTSASDLHKVTFAGTSYYAYSGPTCQSNSPSPSNRAREGVLTLWPVTQNQSNTAPFFMYPAASAFADMGLYCDGTY